MDEILLQRQFTSMGASLTFRAVPNPARGLRHQRITYRLKVEAGPQGEVLTYACVPVVPDQRVARAAHGQRRERHLLLVSLD